MAKNSNEIRKLLGSCFFIGFSGIDVSPSIAKFIKENQIGGVTLFANNYESPAQVAELINTLQTLREDGEPPLIIAVDHEGGRVQRFKKPFTKFHDARSIGDLNSPKLSYDCAHIMSKELNAVGVNLVYAPVADIDTNPKNPVIGRRAFADNEEGVSQAVSAYVRGFTTGKVYPVLKHFPGHGDTIQDSHFHLPKITTPIEVLREREFKPFQKGFKSRCEWVMTAHIIVESLDPKLPATLSKKILQDILRKELRYRGIIISDDMEMKAIADNFGEVDAPLQALEAGVDVLLYHTEAFQNRVFEPLLSKLSSPEGALALDNLKASSARVLEFKKNHLIPYTPVYIPAIESTVGSKEHQEFWDKIDKMINPKNHT